MLAVKPKNIKIEKKETRARDQENIIINDREGGRRRGKEAPKNPDKNNLLDYNNLVVYK